MARVGGREGREGKEGKEGKVYVCMVWVRGGEVRVWGRQGKQGKGGRAGEAREVKRRERGVGKAWGGGGVARANMWVVPRLANSMTRPTPWIILLRDDFLSCYCWPAGGRGKGLEG